MPEHTTFLSYLIAKFPLLRQSIKSLGHSLFGKPLTLAHSAEPLLASFLVTLLLISLAWLTKRQLMSRKQGEILPDDTLTLALLFELLLHAAYNLMKDMMGHQRAKSSFPLIGTAACYILFSNLMGLIPGFPSPTSSWNITLGCSTVVFLAFNYYGLRQSGLGYFKHLMGPSPLLAPLILPLEVISACIRPFTLSLRLMLNIAIGHLLLSILTKITTLLVPMAVMMLEALSALVQVAVFCLLSSIYICFATHEKEEPHR